MWRLNKYIFVNTQQYLIGKYGCYKIVIINL